MKGNKVPLQGKSMLTKAINDFTKQFLKKTKKQKIHLISHFDTDGITAAAIMLKTLERLDKQFSVSIIKQLDDKELTKLPEDKILLFLDLGSNSLKQLSKFKEPVFIIDHHELSDKEIPKNIHMINPHTLQKYEELCAAELAYITSKTISQENQDLANLAIIGMIGDTMEKHINKTRNSIISDAKVQIKKGLLIYPSTRPLDRTLEFSSSPFIPEVTGNSQGVYELLREAGIERTGKKFKALIDLNEKEMKNLTTAVLLRTHSKETINYIGNLYLIKFFNKIEDVREISAIINACSRMDQSYISLMFCLGNYSAKQKAERIYIKYRQHIISGLKYIDKNTKIEGKEYVIINAKDNIKDTIIGTLASILSFSQVYKEGKIIIAMAYNEDKIKVSTRISGRKPDINRNLKELMDFITENMGGISGGHQMAAGCVVDKEHEDKLIKLLQKKLEFEMVKI